MIDDTWYLRHACHLQRAFPTVSYLVTHVHIDELEYQFCQSLRHGDTQILSSSSQKKQLHVLAIEPTLRCLVLTGLVSYSRFSFDFFF